MCARLETSEKDLYQTAELSLFAVIDSIEKILAGLGCGEAGFDFDEDDFGAVPHH